MRPLLSLNWCHGVVLAPNSSTGCRFFRVHATSPLRESVQDHIGVRVLGNPNHRIVRPLDFHDDRQSCILSRCQGGLGPESPPNRGALLTMSAIEWSPPVICGLLRVLEARFNGQSQHRIWSGRTVECLKKAGIPDSFTTLLNDMCL